MWPNHQYVIMGPQGSGKGTQAQKLAERLNIPYIATGDIFRAAIASGSDLGNKIKDIIERGELAPDELTNQIIADRLNNESGFILDGYPRNLVQAEFLDKIAPAVRVINLELSDDEAVARIAGRWSCTVCGAVYHEKYQPPRQEGLCDNCGGMLAQRNDDVPSVVQGRLAIYHQQTEPLLDYYRRRGRLITVDGAAAIEEVAENIKKELGI